MSEDTEPEGQFAFEVRFDVVDSSALLSTNEELAKFLPLLEHLKKVAADHRVLRERDIPRYRIHDTWDGLVAWFADPGDAAEFAIDIRREFRRAEWERKLQLPALLPRIAVHCGRYLAPLTGPLHGRDGVWNARLEPVIQPGEIWVTEPFASVFNALGSTYLEVDPLGERELHKGWGRFPVYRLQERLAGKGGRPQPWPAAVMDPASLALDLARHGRGEQRLAALDALGTLGSDDAVNDLLQIALSSNERYQVRRMALLSLEQLEDPDCAMPLIDVLHDPPTMPALTALILQVLAATGDERAVAPLLKAADGVEPFVPATTMVRERAVVGLRRFAVPKVTSAVLALFADSDPRVVLAACAAAAGQPWTLKLAQGLATLVDPRSAQRMPSDVRAASLEALIALGPEVQQLEAVAVCLGEHVESELRLLALLFVARLDTPDARVAITELARKLGDPLSGEALRALARQRPRAMAFAAQPRARRSPTERLDAIIYGMRDSKTQRVG